MRSAQLKLDQYDSDKISNHYLERYDPVLESWIDKPVILLELGVHKGGSLLLWRDYFPFGTIVGVDIRLPKDFKPADGIRMFEGSQTDTTFLSCVGNEAAPGGFDIIIDDASHLGELTKISFWHLFENHLKPGGLYVIEDWGTGYWDDWLDGQSLDLRKYERLRPALSILTGLLTKLRLKVPIPYVKAPLSGHSYGMVGFIKQLVDEQGAADVTRKRTTGIPERTSKFENMVITPSIVFIRKAGELL